MIRAKLLSIAAYALGELKVAIERARSKAPPDGERSPSDTSSWTMVVVPCGACGSLTFNPKADGKCAMCSEPLPKGATLTFAPGTSLYAEGTIRARTPKGELVFNRPGKA